LGVVIPSKKPFGNPESKVAITPGAKAPLLDTNK